jgi:hypothetical protein
MADWPIWEDNYLVIKGDNGLPSLRYVEGKGWESLEQTSMIDAFGNTVPGWVVETSAVWDGEPTYDDKNVSRWFTGCGERATGSTGLCQGDAYVYVKQFKLIEFMAADGAKFQTLQMDVIFNNGDQNITVRGLTRDVDFISIVLGDVTLKKLMDALIPGTEIEVRYTWGNLSSTISPADLARDLFNNFKDKSPRPAYLDKHPCVTELGCALAIHQVWANKFPSSFLKDVFDGKYGEFVDLSQDAEISDLEHK